VELVTKISKFAIIIYVSIPKIDTYYIPPPLGTVWMVGVNIYPKENDLPLLFAPTNICPLRCLDEGVNVDVDERERDPPQICSNLPPFRGKWN
jgi:hypothetical protein